MDITSEIVLQIIADESGKNRLALVPEAKLTDLDVSSLDLVSTVFTIEDKFGVIIEPSDIPGDATLGELVEFIIRSAKGKTEFRSTVEGDCEDGVIPDQKQ